MKNYIILSAIILVLTFSCTTEPEILENNLEFIGIDASCTEAWLNIKLSNQNYSQKVIIKRDGEEIANYPAAAKDTIIVDTTLTESTDYNYTAIIYEGNEQVAEKRVNITTKEPTSHNISWRTWEFGDYGSSRLRDVAIINENDIWAVGEIYLNDDEGNNIDTLYNALHWNGENWSKYRIEVRLTYEHVSVITKLDPIKSVFSFEQNEVWFASNAGGVSIAKTGDLELLNIPYGTGPGGANAIWGDSNKNMFFTGNNGSLIHYNGQRWKKIETGTDLPINDIYGSINPITGKTEVIAIASDLSIDRGKKIFLLNEDTVGEVSSEGLGWRLLGVWFNTGAKYYISGSSIKSKTNLSKGNWKNENATEFVTFSIAGNELNDIYACGSYGEVIHYNGISWNSSRSILGLDNNKIFYKVECEGNIVIAVGFNGRKARIAMGIRN
ncbi:MAG: hypothetical protein JEY94_15085 [Melioribacteraceae bacterium]|nr:hypothetical protein [Melioribacteraceae bacterium]